jgi:hypothetical protein
MFIALLHATIIASLHESGVPRTSPLALTFGTGHAGVKLTTNETTVFSHDIALGHTGMLTHVSVVSFELNPPCTSAWRPLRARCSPVRGYA